MDWSHHRLPVTLTAQLTGSLRDEIRPSQPPGYSAETWGSSTAKGFPPTAFLTENPSGEEAGPGEEI